MAGGQNSNQPHHHNDGSRGWPDDDNPFVAFRRFANEQISSMLQSVMGIPSMVSPPSPSGWDVFADDPNYARDSRYRQRQNDDANGTETPSGDSTSDNHSQSRSENPWRSHGFGGRRGASSHDLFDTDFFDSFFDKFWFDDHFSSRFFHPYHRPMFSNMVSDDSPTWPVTYLMFSPYSPLHLERQAQYRSHRGERGVFSSLMSSLKPTSERDQSEPQWREAFEDLLRLENGKPMLDHGSEDTNKPETGREWMQGLVKRGSLGDRWKYVSGANDRPWSGITFDGSKSEKDDSRGSDEDHRNNNVKAEFSWNAQPESLTELDLYDRFLNDIEAREREFSRVRESPLLRLLLDDRYGIRDGRDPSREENHRDDAETWLELVSGGQRNSVPDTVPEKEQTTTTPSTAVDTPSTAEQKPYVISTKTTTERVRLSDGSVQTKTIKTKRFADGREESNESVEVVNPPQHNRISPADQDESSSHQNKDGWFWKGN
ncbi:uncharacterized protein KD926_000922 [Aspergillus affinis]|uniref:uncharacterized protein n=1 Tax=Aspergillus affinis TaxID=1070780 RepID=UPI0022FE0D79|nr:uncharacterized protein KD926_000922 [Aspergillus affinis]KAI9037055.1 hypothetical protein KD926_000922 [Aspergillus affinis]